MISHHKEGSAPEIISMLTAPGLTTDPPTHQLWTRELYQMIEHIKLYIPLGGGIFLRGSWVLYAVESREIS